MYMQALAPIDHLILTELDKQPHRISSIKDILPKRFHQIENPLTQHRFILGRLGLMQAAGYIQVVGDEGDEVIHITPDGRERLTLPS